ncbi:MAG: PAS domain-containing protein, partial [Clostridia bacterium]|nr:PAS domain-containing protein [Clostridia bacterium]
MNKKIFRAGFFTSMLVLAISFVMVFGVLFEYFEEQIFAELKSEANYVAYAIENEGVSYIYNFDNENKRITLVSADGRVVADSIAQASELDNHANREEIADALKYGNGRSTRNSDTLMQKTLYYAVRLNDGNILRVSTTQNSIALILLGLMQPLVLIIFIALIVTMFLSFRVSKAIVKPINSIDLDNPSANEVYDELSPLLSKIAAQKATIEMQIRQANQKQEEFKLITENMSEGLLVIDSACNVLTYNHAALKLLEITDVKPGSVLMLNRTKNFRAVIQKALEGQRAESDLSLDEHSYNLIASPVTGDGKIIGAVIVIIDVTESARR